MTRKEAIDLLDNLIGMIEDNHNADYDTALRMAINDLKAEDVCNTDAYENALRTFYLCEEENKRLKKQIQTLIFDRSIKHTTENCILLNPQGLDEGIRCAMCTNSMKSDTGCDGSCCYDEKMYQKVLGAIKQNIIIPVTPENDKSNENEDTLMLDGKMLVDNLVNQYKGEIPSKVLQSINDTTLISKNNVIYAHWKKDRIFCGVWTCSNCNHTQETKNADDSLFLRNNHFCPHCGAYMHENENGKDLPFAKENRENA